MRVLFILISYEYIVLSQQKAFDYVKPVAYVGKRGDEQFVHLIPLLTKTNRMLPILTGGG
jgi:hypothetical protein